MINIKIPYKPYSVNDCWYGRRIKTKEFRAYERDLHLLLPNRKPITGQLIVDYRFYIPDSRRRDLDNFIKPLQDILVKKGYMEDDSQIVKFTVEKIPSKEWAIEITIYEKEQEE